MDGRNLRDRTTLTIGLLEVMADRNLVQPKAILVSQAQSWFSAREQELAESIIDTLATDPDAPLEYVGRDRTSVWLTDLEATQAYLADLRKNPPWFDP